MPHSPTVLFVTADGLPGAVFVNVTMHATIRAKPHHELAFQRGFRARTMRGQCLTIWVHLGLHSRRMFD